MGERQTCVGCGSRSPATDSDHTLISREHGWRLLRSVTPAGVFLAEWRCPECWSKRKSGPPAPTESESKIARFFFARARRFLGRPSDRTPPST